MNKLARKQLPTSSVIRIGEAENVLHGFPYVWQAHKVQRAILTWQQAILFVHGRSRSEILRLRHSEPIEGHVVVVGLKEVRSSKLNGASESVSVTGIDD